MRVGLRRWGCIGIGGQFGRVGVSNENTSIRVGGLKFTSI